MTHDIQYCNTDNYADYADIMESSTCNVIEQLTKCQIISHSE